MKKTLVLGIGNTIMGDDGIGIRIVQDLSGLFGNTVEFRVTEEMGLSLLDLLTGYERVIIIDSAHTGENQLGDILEFDLIDFELQSGPSNHYLGFPELIKVAEKLELPFPQDLSILGIEIENANYIREGFSRELQSIYSRVLKEIGLRLQMLLGEEMVEK